jgi:pimeloyl-ACP methyl ester carboxylesterase
MHYVEHGDGLPVLALHGAGVDHREVMACLDPVFQALSGYRRIYPDLPGMGRTPAPEAISSADDVLDVLLEFIDGVIGDQPLLVVGHSAGGYYAQALAGQRPEQVAGLALLCPLLSGSHDVPEHVVVYRSGDIGSAEFRDYFTVQTAQTLDRYERYVEPAALLADESALAVGSQPTPRPGSGPTSDAARHRTPGLDCRLRQCLRPSRSLSARHLRRAGPGRSRAAPRAARAAPRSDHRMARARGGGVRRAPCGSGQGRLWMRGLLTSVRPFPLFVVAWSDQGRLDGRARLAPVRHFPPRSGHPATHPVPAVLLSRLTVT